MEMEMDTEMLKLNQFQYAVFMDYINSYQPDKLDEKEKRRKLYKNQFYGLPQANCRYHNSNLIKRPYYGPNLPRFFLTYPSMYTKYIELFPMYLRLCTQLNDENQLVYFHFDSSKQPQLSLVPLCKHFSENRTYMRDTLFQELMSVVWHPRNIPKFNDWGADIEWDSF